MTRFSFVIFCRLALLKTCSNRIPNFHFLYYSLVLPRFFVLWKTDYLLEIDLFKADFQLFEHSVIRTKFLSPVEVQITGSLLYSRARRMAKGNYAKKDTVAKSATYQRWTNTINDRQGVYVYVITLKQKLIHDTQSA